MLGILKIEEVEVVEFVLKSPSSGNLLTQEVLA